MRSDDVTAGAAIALGAALSFAFTARWIGSGPEFSEAVEVVRPVPAREATIRIDPENAAAVEIMVGPEGSHSGWVPQESSGRPVR
jgi:hypothetical protein